MNAVWSLWHLHEWLWHDDHPGEGTYQNNVYTAFMEGIIKECPQLGYLRDATDASKHRGLGRSGVTLRRLPKVTGRGGVGGYGVNSPVGQAYGSGKPQFKLELDDGTSLWLEEVLDLVGQFWRRILYSKG
jgi:hypothetical protein